GYDLVSALGGTFHESNQLVDRANGKCHIGLVHQKAGWFSFALQPFENSTDGLPMAHKARRESAQIFCLTLRQGPSPRVMALEIETDNRGRSIRADFDPRLAIDSIGTPAQCRQFLQQSALSAALITD